MKALAGSIAFIAVLGCGMYLMTHDHAVAGGWIIFAGLVIAYDNAHVLKD